MKGVKCVFCGKKADSQFQLGWTEHTIEGEIFEDIHFHTTLRLVNVCKEHIPKMLEVIESGESEE